MTRLFNNTAAFVVRSKVGRSFEPQGLCNSSLNLWWVQMVFMCSIWVPVRNECCVEMFALLLKFRSLQLVILSRFSWPAASQILLPAQPDFCVSFSIDSSCHHLVKVFPCKSLDIGSFPLWHRSDSQLHFKLFHASSEDLTGMWPGMIVAPSEAGIQALHHVHEQSVELHCTQSNSWHSTI